MAWCMQRKGHCCDKDAVGIFKRRYERAQDAVRQAANLSLAEGIAGAASLAKPLADSVLGFLAAPAREDTPAHEPPVQGSVGRTTESGGSGVGVTLESGGSRVGITPESGGSRAASTAGGSHEGEAAAAAAVAARAGAAGTGAVGSGQQAQRPPQELEESRLGGTQADNFPL